MARVLVLELSLLVCLSWCLDVHIHLFMGTVDTFYMSLMRPIIIILKNVMMVATVVRVSDIEREHATVSVNHL